MDIIELKRLAEAATPGPWRMSDGRLLMEDDSTLAAFDFVGAQDGRYIAAANPAAVLALIAEIEALAGMVIEVMDSLEWEDNDDFAGEFIALSADRQSEIYEYASKVLRGPE